MSETLVIANLWHAANRIWTCAGAIAITGILITLTHADQQFSTNSRPARKINSLPLLIRTWMRYGMGSLLRTSSYNICTSISFNIYNSTFPVTCTTTSTTSQSHPHTTSYTYIIPFFDSSSNHLSSYLCNHLNHHLHLQFYINHFSQATTILKRKQTHKTHPHYHHEEKPINNGYNSFSRHQTQKPQKICDVKVVSTMPAATAQATDIHLVFLKHNSSTI